MTNHPHYRWVVHSKDPDRKLPTRYDAEFENYPENAKGAQPLTEYDRRCMATLQLISMGADKWDNWYMDVEGVGRAAVDSPGSVKRYRLFDEPVEVKNAST